MRTGPVSDPMRSLLVLVDPDQGRCDDLVAAFGSGCFQALAVGPEAASSIDSLELGAVAMSLLGGPSLLSLVDGWRSKPALRSVPVAAVVRPGDGAVAEAAWSAGVDEVLPWPDEDEHLRAGLRSLERISRHRHEVAAFDGLLGRIMTAFEGREPATFEHGERVARIAVAMGAQLGLSVETRERMRRGALLHDIGTVILTDRAMYQVGVLGPGALDEVHAHPVVGYSLLKGVPSLEPVLPFVHRHHERINGSGFPDGLRGSEITLPVQVVAIADAYDAMTSARPYRATFSRREALDTLGEEAAREIWDAALLRPLQYATLGGMRVDEEG